jgi:anti-sigma B factor antagonist
VEVAVAVEETSQGVRVSGFLDVRAASEVRAALNRLLERPVGDVVVDVTEVDALDVTGLAVIVAAHRRASRQGRRLVLAGVGPSLARLLAVTRLHRVLVVTRA